MKDDSLMLYIHVPFCVKKCNYCDFLSFASGDDTKERYVDALCKELVGRKQEMLGRRVSSIFFGGGTPSLLSHARIRRILDLIRRIAYVDKNAEITMECNPGTATFENLKGYREAGVNRLSIGLQSASSKELKLLGRIHDYRTFLKTYQDARKAGFLGVNVDLMSAIPGQDLAAFRETLESVLGLSPQPEHLSVYSLILEEGTKFWQWDQEGRFQGDLAIPSEEVDRAIYADTRERLTKAGYEQYEISNYAKPGFECRHNLGYWTRRDYLGLGLGAASLLSEVRYQNETDIGKYLADPLAGRSAQTLSKKDQMEEFLFLGLRKCKGVPKKEFLECFGSSLSEVYSAVIEKNVSDGLLEEDEAGIRLTKRGMDLANYVCAQFLLDEV
ncbi:MAG: radical SAM family heme chaperone HemW [Lachnospiraceae bacterium]|nr:radical SAM family heme chaperone HemW [Lachnospiraceae bacterium]